MEWDGGGVAPCSIGVDMVEIGRIAAAHGRHGDGFLLRLFTDDELAHCRVQKNPYPSLAARFATKEAVAKALHTGFGQHLTFRSVAVAIGVDGAPTIQLDRAGAQALQRMGGIRVLISMAHCRRYAIAQAVIVCRQ
ncbi:MAG: holo-ACP synthase [Puniceicoccales bacterium]|nr:holo-ACP synthase [Puniceicoccales bacterium]